MNSSAPPMSDHQVSASHSQTLLGQGGLVDGPVQHQRKAKHNDANFAPHMLLVPATLVEKFHRTASEW